MQCTMHRGAVSHVIHSISFGEPYPNMLNPLDNQPKILHQGSGYFQYYLKVVPTIYEYSGRPCTMHCGMHYACTV